MNCKRCAKPFGSEDSWWYVTDPKETWTGTYCDSCHEFLASVVHAPFNHPCPAKEFYKYVSRELRPWDSNHNYDYLSSPDLKV